jgi:isoleucyl-tRNA synthetase
MLPGSGFVILNTEVTPDLAAEGVARDVIRAVQQARRDAGLEISDRVALSLQGDDAVREAVERHQHLIETETLAERLTVASGAGEDAVDLGEGRRVSITVVKIED